jgi:hypothetical protein
MMHCIDLAQMPVSAVKATLHLDARQRYGITLNAALSVMFSMTSGTMRSLANITAVSPMRSAESHACRQQLGRVSCWRDCRWVYC